MKSVIKITLVLGMLFACGTASADAEFRSGYVRWYNTLHGYVEQYITSTTSEATTYDNPDFLAVTRYEMPTWTPEILGTTTIAKHEAEIIKDGTSYFTEYDWDMLEYRYDATEQEWYRKWQAQDVKSNYTCGVGQRCYKASETQSYIFMPVRDSAPEARVDFKFYAEQSKPYRIEFNYHAPRWG